MTRVSDKKQGSEEYLEKRAANTAFWRNKAIQHGSEIAATSTTHFIRAATLKRLKKIVKPNSHVLEVGCGNATSLLEPLSHQGQCYGADLSLEMLGLARQHTTIKGVVSSDACCLPFEDASFDLVYTSRCIINVLDPDMQRLAIQEAFRVARPDGTVVFVENFEEAVRRMNRAKKRFHAGPPEIDEHNLLLNFQETLEYAQQLGWFPVWIRGNTLASFVAHVIVAGITRQRGIGIIQHLLHPMYVAFTWAEDRFGERLPLFGKDTMIVLSKK